MSPEREIDETKGANPDEKIAEEAKAAKAAAASEEKPKRRRSRRKKAEEPKAEAEATEATEATAEDAEAEATDEGDGEAEAAEEAPKRRRRSRKADAEEAEAEAPKPAPARARRATPEGPVSVRARARYVRTSARKARLVCDHIRGKSVVDARAILAHTPRAVARDWSKLLESAVANAEHNHELIGDELWIAAVTADEGPTLKRYRPRAMGRATRIRKRTSHLTIMLTPKEF
jgi:ribosomal protein L22